MKNPRLTAEKIASHFQVCHTTVLSWVKNGKLHAHRLPSGHLRFTKEDVNEFARRFHQPLID